MADRAPRGALRRQILAATASLLAEHGDPRDVAIDDVVAAVGCTPPSLYYYFPTKQALLHEVCRTQYEEFAQTIEPGLPEDALDELVERGVAYLDWAVTNPAMYRVLFLDRPVEAGDPIAGPVDPSAAAGLGELIGNILRAQEAGVLVAGDPLSIAVRLWSVVHGIASLVVVNPDLPLELAKSVLAQNTMAVIADLRPRPT